MGFTKLGFLLSQAVTISFLAKTFELSHLRLATHLEFGTCKTPDMRAAYTDRNMMISSFGITRSSVSNPCVTHQYNIPPVAAVQSQIFSNSLSDHNKPYWAFGVDINLFLCHFDQYAHAFPDVHTDKKAVLHNCNSFRWNLLFLFDLDKCRRSELNYAASPLHFLDGTSVWSVLYSLVV